MKRLAIPIVLLLLTAFAGAVWALFAYLDLPQIAATTPSEPSPTQSNRTSAVEETPSSAAEEQRAEAAHRNSAAAFDVARIDPQGTSVFAGRAKPGSSVTIMADGKAIGTTEADENGEWTFAVEHPFASADPKLGLRTGPAAAKPERQVARAEAAGPAKAPIAPAPGERGSAKEVTTQLLKNLEGMVETARVEQRQEPATATKPATAAEPDTAAPKALAESEPERSSVAVVRVAPQTAQPVEDRPAKRKTVPVPITFVFNEATFTEDGRKAAALLLEYLRLKHYDSVTLTGHADERGTDALNMGLSRERLETVASFLKGGGYEGQLDLVPKGESEPFSGVVRSEYEQEELWQLDRRVELVITQ